MHYTVVISRAPFKKRYTKKFRSLENAVMRCESFLEVSRYDLRTAFSIYIYKHCKPFKYADYTRDKKILGVIVHANYTRFDP